MASLATQTMHQTSTNEALLRNTILSHHDKINQPNRTATRLRSIEKLNRFDDEGCLDLDEIIKILVAERLQKIEFAR
jgi:hypothetical protein